MQHVEKSCVEADLSFFLITKFMQSNNYWFPILNHPKWGSPETKLAFL